LKTVWIEPSCPSRSSTASRRPSSRGRLPLLALGSGELGGDVDGDRESMGSPPMRGGVRRPSPCDAAGETPPTPARAPPSPRPASVSGRNAREATPPGPGTKTGEPGDEGATRALTRRFCVIGGVNGRVRTPTGPGALPARPTASRWRPVATMGPEGVVTQPPGGAGLQVVTTLRSAAAGTEARATIGADASRAPVRPSQSVTIASPPTGRTAAARSPPPAPDGSVPTSARPGDEERVCMAAPPSPMTGPDGAATPSACPAIGAAVRAPVRDTVPLTLRRTSLYLVSASEWICIVATTRSYALERRAARTSDTGDDRSPTAEPSTAIRSSSSSTRSRWRATADSIAWRALEARSCIWLTYDCHEALARRGRIGSLRRPPP